MQLGKNIKKIREAKNLSQEEVALSCKTDTGHYSRIENDKSEPALSCLTKIAKALGVFLGDLLSADEVLKDFKDVNSIDKTLMEKIALIDSLDKKEKAAIFTMLYALVEKKNLKDNLSSVLQGV